MRALVLTADLACSSKMAAAAARTGTELTTVFDAAALEKLASEAPTDFVVLDLSTPRLEPGGLVARLRQIPSPPRAIVAFGPHVHEALLAAASSAGCDLVISRGQFYSRIDQILVEYGQ